MKSFLQNLSITKKVFVSPVVAAVLMVVLGVAFYILFPGSASPVILAVLGAAVVVVLASGYCMAQLVRAPVKDISESFEGLSQGDLTKRLDSSPGNEFGAMGKSFNTFVERFSDALSGVADRSGQISFAVNTLDATAGQMARGADVVLTEITSVATASEEMSATATEITNNCIAAAKSSEIANNSAVTGENIIQEIIRSMGRIDERVKESALIIHKLGERSDQIGEIAGIINDIAEQTNLLALNAAIEAARAGEHGRGFAVVADEVRKLAERTTGATKQIGDTIQTMQDEMKNAVVSMEGGVKEVEIGNNETAKSGNALKEILNQINALASQINQIAVASEEQSATTNEINNNIQKISKIMDAAAKNIAENADASSNLSNLSVELNKLANQFKLQDRNGSEKSTVTKEEVVLFVEKAADYLKSSSDRKKVYMEMSDPHGRFVKGDLYIFVNTIEGITQAHGQNPKLVGKEMHELKDADGKFFIKEITDVAKTKGKGWVDYKWINPVTGKILEKTTYCQLVGDVYLGCGIYK
ncbi:MAG: methyl-accepting chemotaxis protein [Syntrophorhabdaceae bacterium]|nr:methyl-accepting chemotaxis protein [Syntrophorhabdaceae bacterium]